MMDRKEATAQKFSLSRRKKSQQGPCSPPTEAPGPLLYTGGFSGALQLSPPAVPPCLLRAGSKMKDTPGMGKVRVMVRICSAHSSKSSDSTSFLKVDGRKKHLTLCETLIVGLPSAPQRRFSTSANQTFTFDAIFSQDASQAEVCSGTVAEVIQSVVNGADGCIFCYGHANLGKTYTMIGRECSTQSLGVAPTAISWLFKVIEERREKSGACFSVGVSAVEISGQEEMLSDLLAELSSPAGNQQESRGPAVSLQQDPICGSQLQNQTELRATSAERAAFFLDTALAERRSNRMPSSQEVWRNSHFLFTLHLYQERHDKSNKAAASGRSRLHILDLGSCETDISRTREGGGAQCLSLSALGNVILALANGAKHVPYRDSKLTMLLSESLGNINCRTTMIAHISDSVANFMETLTTVQLASRVHRTRKKKTNNASSSSGGESSCEEGPSHRLPHLKPFYPHTMALDPDRPLVLSSDPDYSSSSEQSCDTVIYVGPGGAAISDRELSDNEGPPSFVPIIPSLNKKRIKDAPKADGDHLKCNTFAELQERLDCIDGSESPATFRVSEAGKPLSKPTEEAPTPKSDQNSSQCLSESTPKQITKCDHREVDLTNSYKRISSDGSKLLAPPAQSCLVGPCGTYSQDSEPVVREKVFLRGGALKPPASLPLSRTSSIASDPVAAPSRAPPVGMSCQGQPLESRSQTRGHPLESRLELDFLRTTVTLQQPVELNGEDELVFTVIEELPCGLVPDNGRPTNFLNFGADFSLQASRPVSIISSINDEYDAYMTQREAQEPGIHTSGPGPDDWKVQSSVCSAKPEGSHLMKTTLLRYESMAAERASMLTSPSIFQQHGLKSSLNDSGVCFSELDSDPATPNKSPFTKRDPSPDSASHEASPKVRALNTPVSSYSSLPRKTKLSSSASVGYSRQEGRHRDFSVQGSGVIDPRETELLSAGKQTKSSMTTVSSKKSGGNGSSVARSPKVHVSLVQRVVDGCEKSGSRRGDTLIKVPRLTRGATTLGTVSTPHCAESRGTHEDTSVIGTVRFSSLGKKSNGAKRSMISKSGYGNISPPAPLVRQSSQEHKTKSPSALKTSNDSGKFVFPKTSEEEFSIRFRADSFSHRTSPFKTDYSFARISSSLKTRGAKADCPRKYGSLMSFERCNSPSSTEFKTEVLKDDSSSGGGNGRCNRSGSRRGLLSSSAASSSPTSSTIFTTASKLGQAQGSTSSRPPGSGGLKVRTLSTTSSRSLAASSKPPDIPAGRNTGLPPSGKSPSRAGTGTKVGKGTVMGTKQAINRAANNRVSQLAAGSSRKQLGQGSGVTRSEEIDSGPLLPSPYSKITPPRRPQRYSSGHGSDNSSVLSGELPPAMGRTALFYHSGGSSGYESMIRDSETTGSTSSTHDSMSESSASSSNRGRVSKSPKKRGNGGFLRRRLIPAPLPDSSSLGRRVGGQWVDRPTLGGALREPFEIKVYEIDDVERLQRRREAAAGSETFHDVEKGLLYFNGRLKMLERRQQKIRELKSKHERLKVELEEAKGQLMLHPGKWSGEFDVAQDLEHDSQEYLESLTQVTAELEYCVNLCKSRIMMETCFDVSMTTGAGRQRMEA
ncbi:kinesin-like protein KIF26A isoform X2 [Cololabis saira]|uniref:kinesin-like protein KIF26A isoform X2 n=1 Tax=Cololabis saira TaxID=129043 RepID=UPI002AD3F1F2|nr:kinesin-like protein KIF26A isoform X2 [Cololabis saira]